MADSIEDLVVCMRQWIRSHYFGKYRGQVAEVGDGDRLGMIKATVPEVLGEQLTLWAQPSVPFAGNGHGWLTLPEQDDGVWIEFEAGELNRPIWSGFWWASNEIPEPGGTQTRLLATSNGHQVILDDANGEVSLKHGDGPSIVMTSSDITLQVGAKKIVISSTGVDINQGALEVT